VVGIQIGEVMSEILNFVRDCIGLAVVAAGLYYIVQQAVVAVIEETR
jgi:predicted HAD superfamily phosphohydrolase